MKIPKSFTLGGMTWQVVYSEQVKEWAWCLMDSQRIMLTKGMSPQLEGRTFCHELVHSIMYTMGLRDHDEKFVDGFAALLHQYLNQHGK